MWRICQVSVLSVAIDLFYTALRSFHIRNLVKDIVKDTFSKVANSPVNLFFDVTPLGKVLKIFNSEINRFSEGLYNPILTLPYLLCKVLLVIKIMLQLGSFDILIFLLATAWLIYQVALPFLHFEN